VLGNVTLSKRDSKQGGEDRQSETKCEVDLLWTSQFNGRSTSLMDFDVIMTCE
jgi:hypothetical protein